jgi:hypothetical protein
MLSSPSLAVLQTRNYTTAAMGDGIEYDVGRDDVLDGWMLTAGVVCWLDADAGIDVMVHASRLNEPLTARPSPHPPHSFLEWRTSGSGSDCICLARLSS